MRTRQKIIVAILVMSVHGIAMAVDQGKEPGYYKGMLILAQPHKFLSLPKNEQHYIFYRIMKQPMYQHTITIINKYNRLFNYYNKKVDYFKLNARYSYGKKNYYLYKRLYNYYFIKSGEALNAGEEEGSELLRETRGYATRFEHDWKISHSAETANAKLLPLKAENALEEQLGEKIQRMVYRAWDNTFAASLSCEVAIELTPTGSIIGQPHVVSGSSNPKFDHAVIRAVETAAPFVPPIGLPYSAFKSVVIKFNADDLNHA